MHLPGEGHGEEARGQQWRCGAAETGRAVNVCLDLSVESLANNMNS